MKLVSVESPYSGWLERNEAYAVMCVLDSIARGEAPYASHLMLPRVLGYGDPVAGRRNLGLDISDEWRRKADLIALYMDHGMSPGMERARDLALKYEIPFEYREILK